MPAIRKYDPTAVELEAVVREASPAPTRSIRLYANEANTQYLGVWEAEPGLHRDYSGPESVYILQGRATITGSSGQTVEIGPGDFVVVDAGEKMDWEIHETIRKIFVKGTP
ncbi:cupin domain-containing protein [Rhodococcus opacus]|uniref:cupin domain-containing protein n=1 Tax=Rhodococcus opacus TaxID=37919 RepID=UPI001C4394F1|nr:cupin domain-containing protein [Rhodococcus opacus]MBV6761050.1 cupin domain-containing protein [Rhodococcus opacus]